MKWENSVSLEVPRPAVREPGDSCIRVARRQHSVLRNALHCREELRMLSWVAEHIPSKADVIDAGAFLGAAR